MPYKNITKKGLVDLTNKELKKLSRKELLVLFSIYHAASNFSSCVA